MSRSISKSDIYIVWVIYLALPILILLGTIIAQAGKPGPNFENSAFFQGLPSILEKNLAADYIETIGEDRIQFGERLQILTGKYAKVVVPKAKSNPSCINELFLAATKLNKHFPTITFVFDSRVRSCVFLKNGISALIDAKQKVKKNLKSFFSPMHFIYFTDTSKFNHYVLGKMGLYINSNNAGEIARRLIDFKIGKDHIPHETRFGKIGGSRAKIQ